MKPSTKAKRIAQKTLIQNLVSELEECGNTIDSIDTDSVNIRYNDGYGIHFKRDTMSVLEKYHCRIMLFDDMNIVHIVSRI